MKEAGCDGGDMWSPQGRDLEAIRREAEKHDFPIVYFACGDLLPPLNDRSRQNELVAGFRTLADAADTLGCGMINTSAGNVLRGVTRSEQAAAIIEGLRVLAPEAERRGKLLLVEMWNSRVDHPGCFLDNSEETATIIRAVDRPPVKALFDIYHTGIMEGNIIEKIRANIDIIAHFHAAGIPGRHEPEFGEQNYPVICRAIEELGFSGYMGLEYTPTCDSADSLKRTLKYMRGEG